MTKEIPELCAIVNDKGDIISLFTSRSDATWSYLNIMSEDSRKRTKIMCGKGWVDNE